MAEQSNNIAGLVLRNEYVEWTELRRKKNQLEKAGQGQAPLNLPEGADLQSPDAVAAVKKACSKLSGLVSAGIPTDRVLFRVVDLPAVDPDELADMCELQVDKFSPFPIERVLMSYETLSQSEESTRVLVVAVRRDLVNGIGDTLIRAGILPHWIDVEIMGWWHLLAAEENVENEIGRHVHFLCDMSGTDLIITQEGVPLVFRTLCGNADLSPEEYLDEMAEEVGYALTSIESEWGLMQITRISLWHWGDVPQDLVDRLREVCSMEISPRRFEDLPPLSEGLARRAAQHTDSMIDLSPPEWHERERSRRLKRNLLMATVSLVLVWLVAMSVLVFGTRMEESRLKKAHERLAALEGPAEAVKRQKEEFQQLEKIGDRKRSGLECLRAASAHLPNGVTLESFSYKKDKELSLQGQAPSANPVYDYVEALKKTDLFVEVKVGDIRNKILRGRRVSEFKVTAELPGDES